MARIKKTMKIRMGNPRMMSNRLIKKLLNGFLTLIRKLSSYSPFWLALLSPIIYLLLILSPLFCSLLPLYSIFSLILKCIVLQDSKFFNLYLWCLVYSLCLQLLWEIKICLLEITMIIYPYIILYYSIIYFYIALFVDIKLIIE